MAHDSAQCQAVVNMVIVYVLYFIKGECLFLRTSINQNRK
jgi:hypothetical protein